MAAWLHWASHVAPKTAGSSNFRCRSATGTGTAHWTDTEQLLLAQGEETVVVTVDKLLECSGFAERTPASALALYVETAGEVVAEAAVPLSMLPEDDPSTEACKMSRRRFGSRGILRRGSRVRGCRRPPLARCSRGLLRRCWAHVPAHDIQHNSAGLRGLQS